MGTNRLDQLLAKAEEKDNTVSSVSNALVEKTRIIGVQFRSVKAILRELQRNAKLRLLLGRYMKGEVIPFYKSSDGTACISVMYDFEERRQPYIHFILETEESKKLVATETDNKEFPEIREMIAKFPEITPESIETKLYDAIESRINGHS